MVMMLNAISNNISLISWRSILLTGETSVPGENHQPVTSHWQTLSYNVVHLPWAGFELTTLVMIGTDWIGSCNPTTIRSWPQQPLINFKTILKLKKSFYSNSNFLLVKSRWLSLWHLPHIRPFYNKSLARNLQVFFIYQNFNSSSPSIERSTLQKVRKFFRRQQFGIYWPDNSHISIIIKYAKVVILSVV